MAAAAQAAIFVSACVAGVEAIRRLIHPEHVDHLAALAAAGAIGWLGNAIAARIRTAAGRRLDSPTLIGLAITLVILENTWDSWRTVRGHPHRHHH